MPHFLRLSTFFDDLRSRESPQQIFRMKNNNIISILPNETLTEIIKFIPYPQLYENIRLVNCHFSALVDGVVDDVHQRDILYIWIQWCPKVILLYLHFYLLMFKDFLKNKCHYLTAMTTKPPPSAKNRNLIVCLNEVA